MPLEDIFKLKNSELQKRIQKEIENSPKEINPKRIEQLQRVLEELNCIFYIRGKQLSFPRCIVDSWDYSDELGIDLLDLAEIYKKLK